MDAETRRRLDIARSRHPVAQLAITVALEHFTAIMAHSLLTEKDPLPGAPAEVLRLWQWHAIEEVEHKAVAFDTYLAVTRELSRVQALGHPMPGDGADQRAVLVLELRAHGGLLPPGWNQHAAHLVARAYYLRFAKARHDAQSLQCRISVSSAQASIPGTTMTARWSASSSNAFAWQNRRADIRRIQPSKTSRNSKIIP